MKFEIEVDEYSPQFGVRLRWRDDARIAIRVDQDSSLILANREGLRVLAGHLLALAQDGVPVGAHIHLDAFNGLEDNSNELIVELSDESTPTS